MYIKIFVLMKEKKDILSEFHKPLEKSKTLSIFRKLV